MQPHSFSSTAKVAIFLGVVIILDRVLRVITNMVWRFIFLLVASALFFLGMDYVEVGSAGRHMSWIELSMFSFLLALRGFFRLSWPDKPDSK